MARASVQTLLPLDTYARLMGINPLQFNSAIVADVTPEPFPAKANIDPYWFQENWQDFDHVSRETLASIIATAERDIAEFLGYWPAPTWIFQEIKNYTRFYRREFVDDGRNAQGFLKEINTTWGKIIKRGQRAVDPIGTATVAALSLAYSDTNLHGFSDLATITVPTTEIDVCELKVYFAGHGGDPIWEIRPAKTKELVGVNVVFTFDSWQLIKPAELGAYPKDDIEKQGLVNISTDANFVTSVDVYREYVDNTVRSAELFWKRLPGRTSSFPFCPSCGGTGCVACSLITQDGCIVITDVDYGKVMPQSATYNETTGVWDGVPWTECRAPEQVKIWYYAGELSQRFLAGYTCDPLDEGLARAIAILASARLDSTFRANINVSDPVQKLQRDLRQSTGDDTVFVSEDELDNPFGTKRGEIMVYKQLKNLRKRKMSVGVVA